ncbi:acyltransferase family protein [Streptomyces sp. NEAU-Y11]|uniref:acyltransferase family protein n=1 Tax=Streptomyces cucumeris TaxID=2962890 RepID=UPI0020C8DDD7|nr:acyltransferase [Streptomyces sp. NEAU-Y11]MCP9211838.1 acyltransferase [Streptomyces sp. NEAU-Y11]
MASALPQPDRLPSLTGYRFLLACAVLFGHVLTLGRLFADESVYEAAGRSQMLSAGAVSSFFLLSGFVLAWTLRPDDTAGRFWRRRFVKIFPNHAVTWTLMLVLLLATGTATLLPVPDPAVDEAVKNLLLVHTWAPDMADFSSVNPVTWSISCEAFFYLLFPFLIRPLSALPARRIRPLIALIAALVLATPALVTLVTEDAATGSWTPLSMERWWLIYFFPPVRLLEFVLGILLALAVRAGRWPALRMRWPLLVLIALFAVQPRLPDEYTWGAATCLPLAALIPALACRDIDRRPTWLGTRGLVVLGEASFALYMIHFPTLYAMRLLLGERTFGTLAATAIALGVAALCVLVSLVLWRTVELPMMRRYSRPRPLPGRPVTTTGGMPPRTTTTDDLGADPASAGDITDRDRVARAPQQDPMP